MSTFIKAQNIGFSYKTEDDKTIPVFKNLNFEIQEGEFVAILGRNGSGKSTFAKLLNMILTPDEGQIFIESEEITNRELSEDEYIELRRKIGMVFQNPDNQLVATVVEEDVAFGPENLGVPSEEIKERVKKALATVNMTEFAKHSPSKLSGGQKQRIAIAGILAMKPKCIIFDESTAMLDPLGRKDVMNTITKLNKENGLTVIHITHNMEEAILADRVLIMDGGSFIINDTPKNVFSQVDKMISLGLGVPQATLLCNDLIKSGIDLPKDILTEDEAASALFPILTK